MVSENLSKEEDSDHEAHDHQTDEVPIPIGEHIRCSGGSGPWEAEQRLGECISSMHN